MRLTFFTASKELERIAKDIVLTNNSFFRDNDFEQVFRELEDAVVDGGWHQMQKVKLNLIWQVGKDEAGYERWKNGIRKDSPC